MTATSTSTSPRSAATRSTATTATARSPTSPTAAGVGDPRWSTSAAFFDYDRDGDLDLFVANYLDFTLAANKVCTDPAGARDYCSPQPTGRCPPASSATMATAALPIVSDVAGITRAFGAGLGVSVGDYNGDGWLDLYVANDATPNQLWLNQRNGTFVDDGLLAGAAVNAAGHSGRQHGHRLGRL